MDEDEVYDAMFALLEMGLINVVYDDKAMDFKLYPTEEGMNLRPYL